MNLYGKLKSWWRKEPVNHYRVLLKDAEGREVCIKVLRNLCPSEVDERAQAAQAEWFMDRVVRAMGMGRVIGPEFYTMRVVPA